MSIDLGKEVKAVDGHKPALQVGIDKFKADLNKEKEPRVQAEDLAQSAIVDILGLRDQDLAQSAIVEILDLRDQLFESKKKTIELHATLTKAEEKIEATPRNFLSISQR